MISSFMSYLLLGRSLFSLLLSLDYLEPVLRILPQIDSFLLLLWLLLSFFELFIERQDPLAFADGDLGTGHGGQTCGHRRVLLD